MRKCCSCKLEKEESCFSNPEKKTCKKCCVTFSSNSRRLKEYKISTKDYNTMVEKQQGKCLICGIHQDELKKTLSVDHSILPEK